MPSRITGSVSQSFMITGLKYTFVRMTDNNESYRTSRVQNRKGPNTGKVFGLTVPELLLIAAVVLVLPAVLATPVGADRSGSTWWNSSGKYLAAGGIQQEAYTCGNHGAMGISVDLELENKTGYCIGGQEAFVPNDNNDKALPSYVLVSIDDRVATNAAGDPIGTSDTGAFVGFYRVTYPAGHGGHRHETLVNSTFMCNSDNISVPEDADFMRVQPDAEPVFAMADCGNAPTMDHAGSFGTTGTITFNMSS